jgi:hypothetical protein
MCLGKTVVKGFHVTCSLALAFAAVSACVNAGEAVAVTRNHGYPMAGTDYEPPTIFVISHAPDMTAQQIRAVDTYFDSVRKILDEAPVPSNCCVPAIDAPFVQIDISLDGRIYELTMTDRGAAGLTMSLNPSIEERRVASVMERILKLSDDWIRKSSLTK